MKKNKKVWLLGLAFLMICGTLQAEALNPSVIPGNIRWMVHVDVEQFAGTNLRMLFEESKRDLWRSQIREIEETARIDFFKDMKSITLMGMGRDEEKTVVMFTGNLNMSYLLGILQKEVKPKEIGYGKYVIYHWKRNEYGVFMSENVFLMGRNSDSVKTVLDTMDGKANSLSESKWMETIRQFPSHAFITAVADDVSGLIDENPASLLLNKTDAACFMAAESKSIVTARLDLTAESDDAAVQMDKAIQGLVAIGMMQSGEKAALKNLIDGLKVNRDGRTIQLRLDQSSDDFINFILGKWDWFPY